MVKKLGFSDQLSCDLFSGLQLFSAPGVREFGTEMLAQNSSLTFRWFVVKLFHSASYFRKLMLCYQDFR